MSGGKQAPTSVNIEHLTWAIAQRGEIQHTMLGLIQFAEAHPPSSGHNAGAEALHRLRRYC
jgi:hypothetical protein